MKSTGQAAGWPDGSPVWTFAVISIDMMGYSRGTAECDAGVPSWNAQPCAQMAGSLKLKIVESLME